MTKRRRRSTAKVNVPICAAAVLLCLTLISVHLTSGVYARYTVTASGSDSARVIQFGDITLTDTGADELIVIPGVPIARDVTVSFEGSESATYVFVEVITDGTWTVTGNKTFSALDNQLSWEMADGWTYHTTSTSSGLTTYVYYRALIPNETLTNVPVMESGYYVSAGISAADLNSMGVDPFAVNFRASVVQSNGFASVSAAWTSLETNH